jgi:nuclear transport factor 2 (NTF2) superfamily protein
MHCLIKKNVLRAMDGPSVRRVATPFASTLTYGCASPFMSSTVTQSTPQLRERMMSVQHLHKENHGNPRTAAEAKALVKHVESLFMPWNIDALIDGFTNDCVVRFGTVPEFRGREALRAFFTARSGKQKGYRLKKSFRAMVNDTITNVWDGEWQDAETGAAMRGFGVEVWITRDGKIAVWEGAFNTGRADQTNSVADLLR